MSVKYYGVKKGRKRHVTTDWHEAEALVKRYSGAEHMSFATYEEAMVYVYGKAGARERIAAKQLLAVVEQEIATIKRERAVIQESIAAADQEITALKEERAALEQERATSEQERAAFDQEFAAAKEELRKSIVEAAPIVGLTVHDPTRMDSK